MNRRAYKFRIYPNKEQEVVLKKTLGCCRYVFNWALKLRTDSYKEDKTFTGFCKTSSLLTALKKEEETKWLSDVSSAAIQQSLRNLDLSFSNFFKKQCRYPKFKSKKNRCSAKFVGESFYFKNNIFRLNKVKGNIKTIWSRDLPSKPISCVVSQNPSDQWFVSFLCDEQIKKLPKINKKIGIDLGVETLATLSDGKKIKQPDLIRKMRRKLARAQRNQDRKSSGSKNHNKARVKVARIHQRISNIRTNFLQKLSTQLIRENQTIVIEDLAVEKMKQKGNRKLARLISEQGWRHFRTMLEYKSDWYGRELIVIDRFSPTSQVCNSCGKINKLTLDKRKFTCECGVTYDRDVNAAKNILAVGTTVSACGVDVRPISNRQLTMKREVLLEMAG